MLPDVIEQFVKAHPHVRVELLTGPRIYSLTQREADLAFRVVPFVETDIVQRRLLQVRFAVYAREDIAGTVRGSGAGLRLIEDAPTDAHPEVGWLRQRLPEASVAIRSNNRTVQARMCAQGVGIAVLPEAIGDRFPGLRRVPLDEAPPSREVWMGYHRDLRALGRLRAFVEVAVARLLD